MNLECIINNQLLLETNYNYRTTQTSYCVSQLRVNRHFFISLFLYFSIVPFELQVHGHEDDVNTVAFADDSSHILFSGADDGLCKVCVSEIIL